MMTCVSWWSLECKRGWLWMVVDQVFSYCNFLSNCFGDDEERRFSIVLSPVSVQIDVWTS